MTLRDWIIRESVCVCARCALTVAVDSIQNLRFEIKIRIMSDSPYVENTCARYRYKYKSMWNGGES